MKINLSKVKGYNCPNKVLVSVNNKPVCFCNGLKRANTIISHLLGYDTDLDKGMKKYLNKFKEEKSDE